MQKDRYYKTSIENNNRGLEKQHILLVSESGKCFWNRKTDKSLLEQMKWEHIEFGGKALHFEWIKNHL